MLPAKKVVDVAVEVAVGVIKEVAVGVINEVAVGVTNSNGYMVIHSFFEDGETLKDGCDDKICIHVDLLLKTMSKNWDVHGMVTVGIH